MINADFSYCSDTFQQAITEYSQAKAMFESIGTNLTNGINELRAGWQTDAGKSFFDKYTDDFTPSLQKYIHFLEYLTDCLNYATQQYEPIVDEAKRLDF